MKVPALSRQVYAPLVAAALAEDVGFGDVTTEATVPEAARGKAVALCKAEGVICGLAVFAEAFRQLSDSVQVTYLVEEGDLVSAGTEIAVVEGPLRALLTAERCALNFLQHLSGIATLTRRFVDAVKGTGATVLDTRKTTPGLRALEKYAVKCGGGENHRARLDSMILIKDNHLAVAGGVKQALEAVRASASPSLKIEVETTNLDEVRAALEGGADWIMLDNMSPDECRQAVELVQGRAKLEASGGVSLDTVRALALAGVDYISVGALTHSAHALDISLEVTGVD